MVKQKRQTFPLQFTLGVKVTIYYCFYTHTGAYNYHLQSIALSSRPQLKSVAVMVS